MICVVSVLGPTMQEIQIKEKPYDELLGTQVLWEHQHTLEGPPAQHGR